MQAGVRPAIARTLFNHLVALTLAVAALLASAEAWADPPGRVGRIADIGGEVFHAPEDRASDWATIGLNFPVTTGDNLWVADGGRAEHFAEHGSFHGDSL